MPGVKSGDTVRVHYTGTLEDGSVFDSSEEREPLEFEVGAGDCIPGFEKAVVGMEPGAVKTINLEPEQGFGARRDDLVFDVHRSHLPEELEPKVGQHLTLAHEHAPTLHVTVTQVAEESITVDANHPLADRALSFELKLVEIV